MRQVVRVRFQDLHGTADDYPTEGIALGRFDALELLKETRDRNTVVQAPTLTGFPTVANAACALPSNPDGAATTINTETLELLTKAIKGCLKHARRAYGREVWTHWRVETIGNHAVFSLDTNIPGLEAVVLAGGMRTEKDARNVPVASAALDMLKE
ncbi:MAG: hypothetical protein Q4B94_00180 [Pseudomonadota bacterium]|nr:hypothetical protein [Pseudomonadota bacterium]